MSGGLSEKRTTEALQAINAKKRKRQKAESPSPASYPWAISFSFGRALQASAMRLWSAGRRRKEEEKLEGNDEQGEAEERAAAAAARVAVEASSRANREAASGIYKGPHPTAEGPSDDLREGFRGFRDDAVAREAEEVAKKKEKAGKAEKTGAVVAGV